jgi:hypothetical protein
LKQPQNGACPAKQLCERGEAKVPSARRNIVFWIFGGGFIGSLISFNVNPHKCAKENLNATHYCRKGKLRQH